MAEVLAVHQFLHGRAPLLQLAADLSALFLPALFPVFQVFGQFRPAQGQPEGQLVQVLLPVRSTSGGLQHPVGQILPELVGGLSDFGGQLVDLRQPAVQLDNGGHGSGQVHRHHGPKQYQQRRPQRVGHHPNG